MVAQVSYLGDPALHFWLTRSVARVLDVNLSDAIAQGRLTPNDYAEMVARCRQCPHVQDCQLWLATEGAQAAEAPTHCAHKPVLDDLQ